MTAARLAAACLVVAAFAGSGRGARAAGVLTVTVATDSDTSPAPGSLRFLLENEAVAGDTIRFASPFVIPVDGVLKVPQDLDGLRIEGPVELRGGKLDVLVDGLVVTGVRFTGCEVTVGSVSATDPVADPIFRADEFVSGGKLLLVSTRDATVEDCTFDLPAKTTVTDSSTEGSRWVHNTFQGKGKPLFEAEDAKDFVLERNTLRGIAYLAPRSGRIEDNDVDGRLSVSRADSQDTGELVIRNNRLGALTATRPNLDVDGNTFSGAMRGFRDTIVCSTSMAQATGDAGFLRVRNNTVTATGWAAGVLVFANAAASEVLVEDNTVTGAKLRGIILNSGSASQVTGNVLTDCGGGNDGALLVGGEGSSVVDGLQVSGGKGFGVEVLAGAGALRMTGASVNGCREDAVSVRGRTFSFEGNVFAGCAGGVFVAKNTRGDIEGDTIRDHRGSGVFVSPGAQVRISGVSMSGNAGAGIDLSPGGVTTNKRKRKGNRGIAYPEELAFDGAKRSVTGRALPGATIEIYRVEDGSRSGNPKNGEGVALVATGAAGGDGTFDIPVACQNGDLLTLTATSPGADPVTSEFSEDVECGKAAEIELVSQTTAGAEGDDDSAASANGVVLRNMSADGRYVVFHSSARNLDDPGIAGNFVYLRDTQAGTTVRLTRTHDGAAFLDFSVNGSFGEQPSISEDGRWIVYQTNSRQVLPGDENGNIDIVLYDVTTGATTAVTDPTRHEEDLPSGKSTYYGGIDAEISGDGSTVVFSSYDPDWISGDAGTDADFFAWTRATGAFERVSVPTGGGDVTNGTYGTFGASVSHDGRYVAFTTTQQLVAGAAGITVYVRDRVAGTTELVGPGGGARVSDDGRFVVFHSDQALVPADTNGSTSDVYLWDRLSPGSVELISRNAAGAIRGTYSILPFLSGEGRFVAYQVSSTQVELYDRVLDATTFLYQGGSQRPSLSRDGSLLVFQSAATNLVPGRTTTAFRSQVYLRRLPPPEE